MAIDPFVLLAPVLLLAVIAVLRFVGCSFTPGVSTTGTPTIDPPSGTFPAALTVTITNAPNWQNATIYYTADGSTPATNSPFGTTQIYSGAITVSTNTTITAIAQAQGSNPSGLASAQYTITPITPITFRQLSEILETVNNAQVTTPLFAANPDPGNLMVVWIWYNSAAQSVSSVTDTAGNSYQRAVGPTPGAAAGMLAGWQQEIWYAKNIISGANFTVTAMFSGPFNMQKSISAHEYHGADQTSPLDQTAFNVGNTSNASSSSKPAVANELIFGAAIFLGSGSAGPGFSKRSGLQSNVTEDSTVTAAGPVAATFVNVAQDWIAQMVTLK